MLMLTVCPTQGQHVVLTVTLSGEWTGRPSPVILWLTHSSHFQTVRLRKCCLGAVGEWVMRLRTPGRSLHSLGGIVGLPVFKKVQDGSEITRSLFVYLPTVWPTTCAISGPVEFRLCEGKLDQMENTNNISSLHWFHSENRALECKRSLCQMSWAHGSVPGPETPRKSKYSTKSTWIV